MPLDCVIKCLQPMVQYERLKAGRTKNSQLNVLKAACELFLYLQIVGQNTWNSACSILSVSGNSYNILSLSANSILSLSGNSILSLSANSILSLSGNSILSLSGNSILSLSSNSYIQSQW